MNQADEASRKSALNALAPLLKGLAATNALLEKINVSELSPAVKNELAVELEAKRSQFEDAARLASGIEVNAVSNDSASAPISAGAVVPGEEITLEVTAQSKAALRVTSLVPIVDGKALAPISPSAGGQGTTIKLKIPSSAEFTRPYYHRGDPLRDTIYTVDEPQYFSLPLPPPAIQVRANYEFEGLKGTTTTTAVASFKDAEGKPNMRPLAIAPALSVLIEQGTHVMPATQQQPIELTVNVRSNVAKVREGELVLRAPEGWNIEPKTQPVNLDGKGAEHTYRFYAMHTSDSQGIADVRAILTWNGEEFQQGYSVVSRPDLGTAYYYHPAVGRISVVDVQVPTNIQVGYIMGAGDDIPAVLRNVGLDLKMISPEELATGNLAKYGTIILGIRAYDVRDDVRKYNPRLLEYVRNGGTLVVQYNSGVQEFNDGHFTPYPAELGRERVTVEEAPVEVLDPGDDTFDYPNEIKAADFAGWVQERGLYFMHSWDSRYEPLIASGDPGEEPLKGGLLRTVYGKGVYFYTGYAFFRQLPNGVPGAIRLFVNILSAESEWKR